MHLLPGVPPALEEAHNSLVEKADRSKHDCADDQGEEHCDTLGDYSIKSTRATQAPILVGCHASREVGEEGESLRSGGNRMKFRKGMFECYALNTSFVPGQ
jgi:hypothetical protein